MPRLRSVTFWFPGRREGRDVEAFGEAGTWVAEHFSDGMAGQRVESRYSRVQVELRAGEGRDLVLDVLDFRGEGYDAATAEVPVGIAGVSLLDRRLLALDLLVRLGEFMGDMRGWPADAVTSTADHVRSMLLTDQPDLSASMRPRVVLAPNEPGPADPWIEFGGLGPGPEITLWMHAPYDGLADVANRVVDAYAAATMAEGRTWIRSLGFETLRVEIVLSIQEKALGRTTSFLHHFPNRRDLASELWLDPERLQAMGEVELQLFLLEAVDLHVASIAKRRHVPPAPRPGQYARALLTSETTFGPT